MIAVRDQINLLLALLATILHDKVLLLTLALTTIVGSIMLIEGAAYEVVIGLAGMAIYAGLREALYRPPRSK